MNKTQISFFIVALLGLGTIFSYNALQTREINAQQAWSNLEASLQRRADLTYNLVATVKGYAKHEQETFEKIVKLRQQIGTMPSTADPASAQEMQQYQMAQNDLSQSLQRIMIVAENYPELKADKNFRALQHQLEGTENRINVARQDFNEQIALFNATLKTFPNNIVNKIFLGLSPKIGFQSSGYANIVPIVDFT